MQSASLIFSRSNQTQEPFSRSNQTQIQEDTLFSRSNQTQIQEVIRHRNYTIKIVFPKKPCKPTRCCHTTPSAKNMIKSENVLSKAMETFFTDKTRHVLLQVQSFPFFGGPSEEELSLFIFDILNNLLT